MFCSVLFHLLLAFSRPFYCTGKLWSKVNDQVSLSRLRQITRSPFIDSSPADLENTIWSNYPAANDSRIETSTFSFSLAPAPEDSYFNLKKPKRQNTVFTTDLPTTTPQAQPAIQLNDPPVFLSTTLDEQLDERAIQKVIRETVPKPGQNQNRWAAPMFTQTSSPGSLNTPEAVASQPFGAWNQAPAAQQQFFGPPPQLTQPWSRVFAAPISDKPLAPKIQNLPVFSSSPAPARLKPKQRRTTMRKTNGNFFSAGGVANGPERPSSLVYNTAHLLNEPPGPIPALPPNPQWDPSRTQPPTESSQVINRDFLRQQATSAMMQNSMVTPVPEMNFVTQTSAGLDQLQIQQNSPVAPTQWNVPYPFGSQVNPLSTSTTSPWKMKQAKFGGFRRRTPPPFYGRHGVLQSPNPAFSPVTPKTTMRAFDLWQPKPTDSYVRDQLAPSLDIQLPPGTADSQDLPALRQTIPFFCPCLNTKRDGLVAQSNNGDPKRDPRDNQFANLNGISVANMEQGASSNSYNAGGSAAYSQNVRSGSSSLASNPGGSSNGPTGDLNLGSGSSNQLSYPSQGSGIGFMNSGQLQQASSNGNQQATYPSVTNSLSGVGTGNTGTGALQSSVNQGNTLSYPQVSAFAVGPGGGSNYAATGYSSTTPQGTTLQTNTQPTVSQTPFSNLNPAGQTQNMFASSQQGTQVAPSFQPSSNGLQTSPSGNGMNYPPDSAFAIGPGNNFSGNVGGSSMTNGNLFIAGQTNTLTYPVQQTGGNVFWGQPQGMNQPTTTPGIASSYGPQIASSGSNPSGAQLSTNTGPFNSQSGPTTMPAAALINQPPNTGYDEPQVSSFAVGPGLRPERKQLSIPIRIPLTDVFGQPLQTTTPSQWQPFTPQWSTTLDSSENINQNIVVDGNRIKQLQVNSLSYPAQTSYTGGTPVLPQLALMTTTPSYKFLTDTTVPICPPATQPPITVDIIQPVRRRLVDLLNPMAPVCAKSLITVQLDAATVANSVIGTVTAADPAGNPLVWSVERDLTREFGIAKLTGDFAVIGSLTGINNAEVVVRATNPAGQFCETTIDITVTRMERAQFLNWFSQDVYNVTVMCSLPNGTLIMEATARHPNGDALRYRLEGTNEFAVNDTGFVTIVGLNVGKQADALRTFKIVATDSKGNQASSWINVFLDVSTCYGPQFEMSAYIYDVETDCSGVRSTDQIAQIQALAPSPLSQLTYTIIGTTEFAVDPMSGIISAMGPLELTQRLPDFGIVVTDTYGRTDTATVRISVVVKCNGASTPSSNNQIFTGDTRKGHFSNTQSLNRQNANLGDFLLRTGCNTPVGTSIGTLNPSMLLSLENAVPNLRLENTADFIISPVGDIKTAIQTPNRSTVTSFRLVGDGAQFGLGLIVGNVTVQVLCQNDETMPRLLAQRSVETSTFPFVTFSTLNQRPVAG